METIIAAASDNYFYKQYPVTETSGRSRKTNPVVKLDT